jgi:hypothetical protein
MTLYTVHSLCYAATQPTIDGLSVAAMGCFYSVRAQLMSSRARPLLPPPLVTQGGVAFNHISIDSPPSANTQTPTHTFSLPPAQQAIA